MIGWEGGGVVAGEELAEGGHVGVVGEEGAVGGGHVVDEEFRGIMLKAMWLISGTSMINMTVWIP